MSAIVLQVEWQIGGGQAEPTLHRLTTALERAGAELLDVGKHVLPKLLPLLEVETAKAFDAEGGASGSWAPLSVSYKAWKDAHYPGPINVLSGAMRAALTDSNAAGARRDISSDSLSFGTVGIPYASAAQTGAENRPARPPFDFGPDLEAGMQAAAAAGVREAVKAGSDGLLDFDGDTFEGVPVLTGRSGGRYVLGSNGSRTYLKKAADGRVVQRTFGGSR